MTTLLSSFQKNWSAYIRNLLIGIILAWITFYWTTKDVKQSELIKKVESKLDVVEFKSHEIENNREFERVGRTAQDATTETNQLLRQILEQQAKTSTDIEWIKKRVK